MKLWVKGGWSTAVSVYRILNKGAEAYIVDSQQKVANLNPETEFYTISMWEPEIRPTAFILNQFWYMGGGYRLSDLEELTSRAVIWKAESDEN